MSAESDELDRGMAALGPFVQRWNLPLNPEDWAEIIHAVLLHASSDRTFEEIDRAVRAQLDGYEEKQRTFKREAYGSPDNAG